MTVFLRVILSGALLLGGSFFLYALDGPAEFTLDLPFGANEATPVWLGHPATPPGTFATLDLPVTPPDPTASLLVTVFYQEETGGFLRISWEGGVGLSLTGDDLPGPGEVGASSILCDNFYEGIGMSNQRSLLVSADTLKEGGTLHFQTGGSTLGISRLKLEWLENSTGLTSPAITDVLVTSANGKTQLASELAGTPPTAEDPAWKDRIVTVPITDVPVRIEQGVDFTVQMDGVPTLARLSLKETGLPWGQHLVVWLNNQRAGVIYPGTPSLDDPGYPSGGDASPYVGWRDGTFFVPVADLAAGNDVLQFSTEPDVPSSSADATASTVPLAVKDVSLQLDYPAGSVVTTPAPAPAASTETPAPATSP
jgi:hypothetical protein